MSQTSVFLVVSSLGHGGAERQVVQIANNNQDYRIYVVSLSNENPLADTLDDSSRLIVLPKRMKYDIFLPMRLARLAKRCDVRIMHGVLFDADLACRLSRIFFPRLRVIGSERNADYRISRTKRILTQLSGRLCHSVVANSEAGLRFAQKKYHYDPARMRLLRNGVDVERFRPKDKTTARIATGLPNGVFLVGMVASFKAQKNHLGMLDAFAEFCQFFPNSRLVLLGDSLDSGKGAEQQLKRRIKEAVLTLRLVDKVIFLGVQASVEDFYPAFDVLALPSHHEGTPNVVLEAMACGVCPLVCNVADNALVVQDGKTGRVIQPDSTKALFSALVALHGDTEGRDLMARAARETAVSKFSNTAMSQALSSIYAEIL